MLDVPQIGTSALDVSADQVEASELADRTVVLEAGRIVDEQ